MKSQFIEMYQTLDNMKPGDIAVSKDRTSVYVCGIHFDPLTKESQRTILDMNDLYYNSAGGRDLTAKVKILVAGDKFNFEK
jgi:hypothetical protein